MIQPPRVLPSNAPPLQDAEGAAHHVSRVLQDAGQLDEYSYLNAVEQRYPAALLTGTAYSGHQPVQPVQLPQLYRPGLRARHGWRHAGSARHYNSHEDQERNEKIARFLYSRFRSSDQYMKYRNRQHKDEKGNQKQKWPDRLELAFFQALVKWPPMGRRKLHHKDKQRGRNELIADHIEELTGEARTRKQVSSHIQVLKPFVEHDPYIMKWLSKEDFGVSSTAASRAMAAAYGGGRRMSHHPVTALPDEMHGVASSNAPLQHHDLSKAKHSLSVFEPVDFSMFVQRKLDNDKIQRLHTYTQSIQDPLQRNEPLADWATLQHKYPILASLHAQRPLDCNVLLAEASLAFPTELWKDQDGANLPGVELGIAFLCASRHLPESAQVYCQNSFYKHGQNLRGEHNGTNAVYLTPSDDGQGVETQVKFGSSFWARTLAHLASQLRTTPNDATKDVRSEVATHIAALNAVQEIFVMTERGSERVLVVYWRFRLSTQTRGRAWWQRLLQPSTMSSEYPDPTAGAAAVAEPAPPLSARVDSVFEYPCMPYSADPSQSLTAPSLQPPFEYDSTTSGSALTSATWPSVTHASFDSDAFSTAPNSAIDYPHQHQHPHHQHHHQHTHHGANDSAPPSATHPHHGTPTFDFTASGLSLPYDNSMVDFSSAAACFDSSAFNFDVTAADAAAFVAGDSAALYSSHPHHTHHHDGHSSGTGAASNPGSATTGSHPAASAADWDAVAAAYGAVPPSHAGAGAVQQPYGAHASHGYASTPGGNLQPPPQQQAQRGGAGVPRMYVSASSTPTSSFHGGAVGGGSGVGSGADGGRGGGSRGHDHAQAYGGAGPDGMKDHHHEAALAALADASYMVRGMEHA